MKTLEVEQVNTLFLSHGKSAYPSVAIPRSTQRSWARRDVRPVVAAVDVELEVYDLLEQVDKLRKRAKVQATVIGLQVRLLKLRGGKLHGDRIPMA